MRTYLDLHCINFIHQYYPYYFLLVCIWSIYHLFFSFFLWVFIFLILALHFDRAQLHSIILHPHFPMDKDLDLCQELSQMLFKHFLQLSFSLLVSSDYLVLSFGFFIIINTYFYKIV